MSGPVPGTPTPWEVVTTVKEHDSRYRWHEIVAYGRNPYSTPTGSSPTCDEDPAIAEVFDEQTDGDFDIVGEANAACIVHRVNNWDTLEAERDALKARVEALVEAVKTADAAIKEMFRYFDGGETRGSYDGKPERNQLRKAGYVTSAALAKGEQP